MGSSLGTVTVEEGIQSFPLRLQLSREFVGPRLAIVGDAAHVIHPLAGQGLNLGLKDVAALAETIIDAMRLGLDHGSPDVLARYQQWRRFDTALMAAVTRAQTQARMPEVGRRPTALPAPSRRSALLASARMACAVTWRAPGSVRRARCQARKASVWR